MCAPACAGVEAVIGVMGFWAVALPFVVLGRLLASRQRDAELRTLSDRESAGRQAADAEHARNRVRRPLAGRTPGAARPTDGTLPHVVELRTPGEHR